MPFVTEELWQRLVHGTERNQELPQSISLTRYVKVSGSEAAPDRLRQFALLQETITAARELRADNKLDPKAALDATLYLLRWRSLRLHRSRVQFPGKGA